MDQEMQELLGRLAKAESEIEQVRLELDALKSGRFKSIRVSEGLQIVDEDEKLRAALVLLNNEPAFAMVNKAGKIVMSCTVDDERPNLSLNDASGDCRLKLRISAEDDAMLVANGSGEEPRLSLSVQNDSPRLMFHEGENVRVAISLDPSPYLQFYDRSGMARVSVGLSDNDPVFVLADSDGNPVGDP